MCQFWQHNTGVSFFYEVLRIVDDPRPEWFWTPNYVHTRVYYQYYSLTVPHALLQVKPHPAPPQATPQFTVIQFDRVFFSFSSTLLSLSHKSRLPSDVI